jgi:hypothetical protein
MLSLNEINKWADFWHYEIGVNVFPANYKKKKTLDFDIDISYLKLKFLHKSKSKRYRAFNVVTDDGKFIYFSPFEELATDKGQVFISENKIEEIVNRIFDQRLRPFINTNKNGNK